MSETADGKFLRRVAGQITESLARDDNELADHEATAAKLRELADRCDIVAYPSLTLEARVWKEIELRMSTSAPDWDLCCVHENLLIGYLIAVQLKALGQKTALAGTLAGIGGALSAAALQTKVPDKKGRHR